MSPILEREIRVRASSRVRPSLGRDADGRVAFLRNSFAAPSIRLKSVASKPPALPET